MSLADRVKHSSELGLRAEGWYWLDEDGVARGPMSHGNATAACAMHFEVIDVG